MAREFTKISLFLAEREKEREAVGVLRVEKANLTLSRAGRRLTSIKEENSEGLRARKERRSKNRKLHETRTKTTSRWPSPRFAGTETKGIERTRGVTFSAILQGEIIFYSGNYSNL